MSDNAKGGFDALLEEIGGLAKAMPPADESGEDKVEAAAAEAEEDPDKDEDEKPMAKSYVLKGADGEEIEAIDGTELVKSLIERIEGNETAAIEAVTGLLGVVKSQGALIKSMQTDLAAFKDSGKPRKTVLTVAERPAGKSEELAKSQVSDGVTPTEFMVKALEAQVAGKLTSRDIALAEQLINSGQPIPVSIRRAVLS